MKVEQAMNHNVAACHPHDPLNKVAQFMWESTCGCVPVVDEDHRPLGMLTDRDICMAAYTQGKPLADLCADSAMARKLICCKCDDDLTLALNTMGDNGVRRLPVVGEHGRLVGILSLDDVVVESRRTPRGVTGQDLARQVSDVFASICVHRARRRSGS
jgi:CBS domain-containing protein